MSSGQQQTRLYLVRHCDVHNPRGVLYGHLPGFPLSKKGVRQAQALGEFFEGKPIRKIYTSPLERAVETAQIIASHIGDVPIVTTSELIEAHFGQYLQGIKPAHILWRKPMWWVHMAFPGLPPDDERVDAMAERVRGPLVRLLDEFPGESGICVSHGDPIQAFWVAADGRPSRALHRLQCAKGGVLELDYADHTLINISYRANPLPAKEPAEHGEQIPGETAAGSPPPQRGFLDRLFGTNLKVR
ncbi:MAG TPA: histidine phosphatase family protein [Candidatus Sulfotelmatobacter sp.]|nr:histidine phosphatase family protein [Candidatus Sulfotelmatobacter sp.]